MNETAIIKTEKLGKNYGRRLGISAVDIEIFAGEIFGYLGPNGAGKTTTIRVLLDFIRASAGKAEIFGLDVRKYGVPIRRRMGFLPGELNLYENLNGRELLLFFSRLRGNGDWAYVDELASRFQCPLSQPVATLSQGNKRKIGLIQAFMHKPELIMLDEPTNGLDPLMQHEFYRLLGEARAAGQTIFFSSHNLPEVERVCDRVGIIRAGRMVAVESVAALKARTMRNVEIHFNEDVDVAGAFSGLENLRMLGTGKRWLKCQIKGELDQLLKVAARFSINDFISREPDLEEVFLAFYGDDRHAR
ncbi:MAG: ABC transporter ATP-binding protein [Candidatus Aminicenantes bacterium]|nr:ABC transporter ATP-binding protein [Candidatus Aminicenantes bacterium]